ncbi:MAG: CheR family methyltransferase [Pseudomonadota bacterium]
MGAALRQESARDHRPTPSDIARLNAISSREAGIILGPDKADFLSARLSRIVKSVTPEGYGAYCGLLEGAGGSDHVRTFLEAIATHTTSFFREKGQYEWLDSTGFRELWDMGAGKARDLVIWSAACSTGQELYTAMLQAKASSKGDLASLRVKGVGTDLSQSVVAGARRAVYDTTEISGIPLELRKTYLLSAKSGDGRHRIGPEIRALTDWRTANLTKRESLSGIEADVVFLRNVLIYFDEPTQVAVLRNVLSRLRPGGFLLTGHSETASAREIGLSVVRPAIYRKEKT